jgi:hypothetical protein
VFISSTFRDMHGERDVLTRFVFPELRARGRKHFLNIQEVDLRWGITEEESNRWVYTQRSWVRSLKGQGSSSQHVISQKIFHNIFTFVICDCLLSPDYKDIASKTVNSTYT